MKMKHTMLGLALAGSVAALTAIPASAMGPTAADLINDAKTTGNVTTYGMGYGQQRYSRLNQINRSNVKKMVPVWNLSLDSNQPQSQQPLLIDGVMYLPTVNATLAVDALTGKQLWRTPLELPEDVYNAVCCGNHNRGVAAHDGVIYRTVIDASIIALDMKTGKQLWKTVVEDYKQGYSMTAAPLVANGVLITGISGGEYGIRGFIDGHDLKTGKQLWRKYTTAAPGEPGGDTWPGDTYKRGGGSTWLTGSYDPELDLVYWGTGNGGPWNPAFRGGAAFDNKYIASVLAMRPKTGELVWHYQFSPNDAYDYDGVNENVIADMKVGGKMRKTIIHADRNGFFYVIDRTNGQLLAANKFVDRVDWAKGIDIKTGRPIDSEMTARHRKSLVMEKADDVWPSALGGKNWNPIAYNPETNTAFIPTLNFGMAYRNVEQEWKRGQFYIGMDFTGFTYDSKQPRGYLKAIDPVTAKEKWSVPLPIPYFAGVMATKGGLVFTGAMTGEFLAYDDQTGKKLWSFQTGSGIVSMPITWEKNGKQYVTVASGTGGVYALYSGDERLKNVPTGSSLWTFALAD
jgi:alcohol dehydrogenase (cytochrome c)